MNIHILEMLDYGASRHGSDMGPSAIRLAGIRSKLESIGHKIVRSYCPIQIEAQEYADIGTIQKANIFSPIIKACTALAQEVESAIDANEFPLVLGGDHSIALGTIAGLSASYKKTNKKARYFVC